MKSISTSRNVLFGFLGWVLPLGCTVAFTPMIVHGLGPDAYGLYAVIVGVIGYLASMKFNVGRSVTKYISACLPESQARLAGEVLSTSFFLYMFIGVAGAVLLVASADWLVVRVLAIAPVYQSTARLSLYLGAAGLTFTLLAQLLSAAPQALQRFDLYGYVTIGSGVAAITGNGLMVWLGFGFAALIAWNVVVGLFACLAFAAIARRLLPGVRLTVRLRKSLLMELLRFSGAVTIYQVAGNLIVLFERGWITRVLGSAAVTYYVIPMTIAIYIHAFIASLTQVVFPMASEASAGRDMERVHRTYTHALKYICVLLVFIAVSLFSGSRELLANWMGQDFSRAASEVLRVHVVTFTLMALAVVPWQIADGIGFPRWNAVLSLVWLLFMIPLAITLVGRMGILGMAYARGIVVVLSVPFYIGYIERRVFGRILWSHWWRIGYKLAAAGLVMALILNWLLLRSPSGWIWLAVDVFLGGLSMAAVLWIAGYLDGGEKEWLKQFSPI